MAFLYKKKNSCWGAAISVASMLLVKFPIWAGLTPSPWGWCVAIPGGCFTDVLRALQDILSKFVYRRNLTSYETFKLKLCTCAQSHALGTGTKFQLEIITVNVISGIDYFWEIILESLRNVSETTPRPQGYHSTGKHSPWSLRDQHNIITGTYRRSQGGAHGCSGHGGTYTMHSRDDIIKWKYLPCY